MGPVDAVTVITVTVILVGPLIFFNCTVTLLLNFT